MLQQPAYPASFGLSTLDTNSFAYNNRYELKASVMGTNNYAYNYDQIGNNRWTALNSATNYYTANQLNQYTEIANSSSTDLQYDPDGNLIYDGAQTYRYDAENRLIAVYDGGALIVSNAYDHASRRVLKVTPTATHTYLYDGWNLVQETISNQQSTITNHYVWGKDLSGTLQGAGGVGGLLAVIQGRDGSPCRPFFPLYDNNGNITTYVNDTGNIVAEYRYDAFGNTISQSGTLADTFPHRLSTKYYDPETGLYYYGYRFYAPAVMRWLNRDPIEEEGGLNLYSFVGNNVANKLDWLGKSSIKLHDFFSDSSLKAKYNITENLEVKVYCLKPASTARKLGRAAMLGFAGGNLDRTLIPSSSIGVNCHCGIISIVINPKIGTPPEFRMPIKGLGSNFFGKPWGEIPELFEPITGWSPPEDFWGIPDESGIISRGPGGVFKYPVHSFTQANFNVGRFVDHKESGSNIWLPVSHSTKLFSHWYMDIQSVNTWDVNMVTSTVYSGDKISIQVGCAGEQPLARRQIIEIR